MVQARKFLRDTGVDILVPNVGTEHRATADQVRYLSENAREISAALGKILCLHGTSSVKPEDLLKEQGFDISKGEFWQEGFNLIKKWLNEVK